MNSASFGRSGAVALVRRALGASALAAMLAACSGGGTQNVPTPSNNAPQGPAGMAQVTFTMSWNNTLANVRTPKYVPATARSVSVSVNGGTPQFLNAPASTIVIDAPVGTDTFAFATFDDQNGQGNVLSRATVTKAIVSGSANTVTAVLNGVVVAVTISLSNPSPNAGVPATVNVNVAAKDADGNTIVGPGDYSTPIRLTINDPSNSGTLSLSTNSLPNSTTTATLTYNGGTVNTNLPGMTPPSVTATATGVSNAAANFTVTPTFYQFSIPVAANRPQFIAAGSDGNMWFTENPGGAVARITPAGVVTEFTVPTANAQPQMIIGASDGSLWFTEFATSPPPGTSKIARVTTAGTFTEFSTLFAPPPPDNPLGLVDRGDGNIWYVANGSSRVGFQGISSGVAGETSIPTANSGPFGIATAPDNNLYYTESATDKIGRISNLFTAQSEISLTAGTVPEQIVRGPDGNLWFTENGRNNIGRLSPNSFSVTGEFPTLTPNSGPTGITVGADGALWFTESGLDRIGRITTGGTVVEFASPVTGLGLKGIGPAADGSLWVAEPGTGLNPGRIGKLVY
jgi:streptogramin lyase